MPVYCKRRGSYRMINLNTLLKFRWQGTEYCLNNTDTERLLNEKVAEVQDPDANFRTPSL
jgi:hypothetical protein